MTRAGPVAGGYTHRPSVTNLGSIMPACGRASSAYAADPSCVDCRALARAPAPQIERNSELWIAALLVVAGVVLLCAGHESEGSVLLGVVSAGYSISRGVTKAGRAAA